MSIFPWNKKDPITEELFAANMLKTSEKIRLMRKNEENKYDLIK